PAEKPFSAVWSKEPKPYFEKRSVLREPNQPTDVRRRLKPSKWKSFESWTPNVRYVSLPGSNSGLPGRPHAFQLVLLFHAKRVQSAYPSKSQIACICARRTKWSEGIANAGSVSSFTRPKSRCVSPSC